MAHSSAVAAVTGKLFEAGWADIRGRGPQRQQQATRAARGFSPAVFKPVREGGCRTRAQLSGQLTYLTTKSSHIIDSRSVYDGQTSLNEKQINDLVDRFSGNWSDKYTPKMGNTTHMIMAFPIGTKGEHVRDIAEDVCERFFMQEGRQFDYIVAIHEDRAHPHAHVVLNRRSAEGELFYFKQDHHFNYDDFRLAMVEAAEKHGIRLEATRRLDRGVDRYSPAKQEVYRAKEEGRAPVERERVGRDLDRAIAHIATARELYRSLAVEASTENREDVADALERAAGLLAKGGQIEPDGEVYMSEVHSFDELRGRFSEQAIRAEQMVREIEPSRRAAIERELNDIYARVSHMQPLGTRSATLREEPTEAGIYAEPNINRQALDRLQDSDTRAQIDKALEGTGISSDAVISRIDAGANNAALERQWMADDLRKIAEREGLDLARRDEREAAMDKLDQAYVRLGEALHERQILRDSGVREEIVTAEADAIEARQGIRATHEGDNRVESVKDISPALAALHQRYFNENLDNAARDRAGAEQLMNHVSESYPKDQLKDDTELGEVADHYVREHFPNETPERQNEIAGRIEEANEIRQGLYMTWNDHEATHAAGDPDVMGAAAEAGFERGQQGERQETYETVLQAMRRDSAADPFRDAAERSLYRAEIESRLNEGEIEDLRQGREEALTSVADNRLDRLYAAKAYMQTDAVTATSPIVKEINTEIASEEVEVLRERIAVKDTEKGPTHG